MAGLRTKLQASTLVETLVSILILSVISVMCMMLFSFFTTSLTEKRDFEILMDAQSHIRNGRNVVDWSCRGYHLSPKSSMNHTDIAITQFYVISNQNDTISQFSKVGRNE